MEQIAFEYKGKQHELNVEDYSDLMPMASSLGTDKIEKIGKMILNHFSEKAVTRRFTSNADKQNTKNFFENLGFEMPSVREDLTFPNNPALYTTIVNAMVERAFRPQLIASGLIRTISVNPRGVEAIKFPISKLRTALDLPDSGVLPDADNENYASETITLKWIYSYEVITHQIIQQSIVDIVADQLFELGDALSRKVDRDVIVSWETASPSDNSNSNFLELSGNFNYVGLVTGVLRSEQNNASPDSVVTSPLTLLNFVQDSNVITALGYNSQAPGTIFPRVRDFFGTALLTTTQATSGNVYILDSQRTKYYVEGTPIQVYDGRKSGTVNWELIALKLYGVKVIQPEAVFRLVEAGAESS